MTEVILMRLSTGPTLAIVAVLIAFALFVLSIPAISKAAAEDRAERMRKAWDEALTRLRDDEETK